MPGVDPALISDEHVAIVRERLEPEATREWCAEVDNRPIGALGIGEPGPRHICQAMSVAEAEVKCPACQCEISAAEDRKHGY